MHNIMQSPNTGVGGSAHGNRKSSCEHCVDPDGESIYPHYGVAPHTCFFRKPGGIEKNPLGTSDVLPKSQWPENFIEDEEAPGCGTYTHCLVCGGGR